MTKIAEPGDSTDCDDGKDSNSELFYRLDAGDVIIETGGIWSEYAAENDGWPALTPQNVVGTSIYAHVSGHFTKRFLRAFLAEIRSTGTGSRYLYRCDTPTEKRMVELRCHLEPDGVIHLSHRLVKMEALPFAVQMVTAPPSSRPTTKRCSMCNRLQRRKNQPWLEPELATKPDEMLRVVHTVCLQCRDSLAARRLSLDMTP